MGLQEKEEKQLKRIKESCLESAQKKVSINSRLKHIYIIGQRKVFCRQKVTKSNFVGKETFDIDILITSRNDDRKILQPIRVTDGPPTRIRKWDQFCHFRRTSTKVIPVEKT